ncbi:type II toxin-antitoxin system HicB family antitoxin [Nostoc sp. WHI]|uniref:type II toxin-antitoxin system HicB family antitoxin n=1 Tax=Nostoc sp. WHI TaxID=2650611 RepID=UPI001E4D95D7|nr:type II toxin-antitoxin system HicB family antitoxin [Nostoc sp. WHI]MBG1266172.1 type II toxin-antitoxin system HicB family antitoxin [Nostoc sp. WHI]
MNDMMQYKDYFGSIHYSDEDKIFYGQIEHIRSLISFEGEDVASLRASFEEAIDDYLALCEEKGIEPEKPFKGSFNVRVGSQLHRQAALYAQQRGVNLNKLVTDALERYLFERGIVGKYLRNWEYEKE